MQWRRNAFRTMDNRMLKLSFACLVSASAFADGVNAFTAYSMLTRDGRRMVSHVEGTNTVYELVPTNQLPAGLPPVRLPGTGSACPTGHKNWFL